MLKTFGYKANKCRSYQQALDDFGVTELLSKLSKYSNAKSDRSFTQLEPQEIENLATILISQLIQNIDIQLITNYIKAIRIGNQDILPGLIHSKSIKLSTDLPNSFPYKTKIPRFLYGDRLRWRTSDSNTDWGIVIGRFYNFAPHLCSWNWCYLIWLNKDSISAAWISADIAWEEDVEPMEKEQVL